jgi:hypothetical protein
MKQRLLLAVAMLCVAAQAQVPVNPIIQPHVTFVNGAGQSCASCTLSSYSAGTTSPIATYTDASGTSQNTNPIVLDAAGGANIWLSNSTYKFVLKSSLGATIWSVDLVKGGGGLGGICGPAGAIQIANSAVTGLTCDSAITIDAIAHTLTAPNVAATHVNIGTSSARVAVGPLSSPTSWNLDTTTPATALASLGSGIINAGTIGQLAYYAAAGTSISGTSAIPSAITATTQAASDNSTKLATTAYTAAPGAVNPTSVKIAAGVAITGNQGNGLLLQHSTGATVTNNCVKFDSSGNAVDAGFTCTTATPRTCNANGCYRIESDGTITAWGIVTAPTSGGTVATIAITFPTTFTASPTITVSGGGQADGTDDAYAVFSRNPGTAGATAVVRCSTNIGGSGCAALSSAVPVNWIAIGQ